MYNTVYSQRSKADERPLKEEGLRTYFIYSSVVAVTSKAPSRSQHARKEHFYAQPRNATVQRDDLQRSAYVASIG